MLKASERLSDNYLLANAHIKLGEIQNQEEHHEKVLRHYKQALQYAEGKEVIDLNNKSIQKDILLDVNIKLTNYYLDRNNPEEAFIYLLRVNINLSFVEFDTSIPIIALTASEID